MNNTHDDLDVQWADIDGEGLVRVFATDTFRDGLVLVARIGKAAERVEYYPEVVLATTKVVVTIPPNDDGLDHHLAHAIDAELGHETTRYA